MPPYPPASSSTLGLRVLGGAARVGLAQALLPLTGLITAAVLTRHLGPDGYGLFTLSVTLVVWFEFAIVALLGNATVHWIARADERSGAVRSILRLYIWTSVAVAALLWVVAPLLAAAWNEPQMTPMLRFFALDVPIYCMARGYGSVLAGQERFGQQAAAIASRWVVRLLLTVVLVSLGFSIWGAMCAMLGASLVELAVASRRVARPALWRAPSPVPGLWALAGPLFVSAIAVRVLHLDLVLLKALGASATEAGFYGAAYNLALAPVMIAGAASGALLATLTRGATLQRDQAERVVEVSLRILLAGFPVAAVISGSSEAIVALIYGSGFRPAGELLALLIFSSAGLLTVGACSAMVIALGRPRLTLLPVAVIPPAVAGYLLVVPQLGPVGCAYVTTAAALAACVLGVAAVVYAWRIPLPLSSVLRCVLLTGVGLVVAGTWSVEGFWVVGKLIALGVSIPFAYALLGELGPRDRDALRGFVRGTLPPPFGARVS